MDDAALSDHRGWLEEIAKTVKAPVKAPAEDPVYYEEELPMEEMPAPLPSDEKGILASPPSPKDETPSERPTTPPDSRGRKKSTSCRHNIASYPLITIMLTHRNQ